MSRPVPTAVAMATATSVRPVHSDATARPSCSTATPAEPTTPGVITPIAPMAVPTASATSVRPVPSSVWVTTSICVSRMAHTTPGSLTTPAPTFVPMELALATLARSVVTTATVRPV